MNVLEALESSARQVLQLADEHVKECMHPEDCNAGEVLIYAANVMRAAQRNMTLGTALGAAVEELVETGQHVIVRQLETCMWCRLPIVFDGVYKHLHTGTYQVLRCRKCGWKTGEYVRVEMRCIFCDSEQAMIDDHVATPNFELHSTSSSQA